MTRAAASFVHPRPGDTMPSSPAVKFGRAAMLRCPRCGGRGILETWFRMRERCPTCGMALERGETSEFWIGAYVFNLAIGELFAFAVPVVWMIATAPHQPWTAIELVGAALAVALPLVFFPFSRTLWLAWDLSFRPSEPGDFGRGTGAAR